MAERQIAALFDTEQGAQAAQDGLLAIGVRTDSITVLQPETPALPAGELWASLKACFIPDEDAHPFAEAIDRGHIVVIALITPEEQPAAEQALRAANPLNLDAHATSWRDDGWDGVHAGQDDWLLLETPAGLAEGSEGIRGGLIIGDYGAVGAAMGSQHVDTDILRGKRGLAIAEGAVRIDAADRIRVYERA